jgi:branched-chain amino acid transport system ATP-binding protein
MALLDVVSLDAGYGLFQALFGTDLAVHEGEAVAIIGANGAGKSTLLKAISGLVPVRGGDIMFDGRSLGGMPAHRRVADGISLVPEGRRIFPSLSVDENLVIGGYRKRPGSWTKQRVYAAFPLLERIANRSAARLSGGEQQALAIGRALMANPRLILMDEVSLGLAPVVVHQLYDALPSVRQAGTTLLLVEQDINQALAAADRVYCLLEGRIVLEGTPAELTRERITHAYFGVGAAVSQDGSGEAVTP